MFPILYHSHHSLHQEDLPFWRGLADLRPGPLLELGCGTGRVLLTLWHTGYRVAGLDHSLEMLRYLYLRLPPGEQPRPAIFQADMAHFHLARQFPLIILPCNTLSTLSVEACHATLSCVRRHLTSQGLFAFSLPNPTALREMPLRGREEVEETFIHPLSGNPVQVSSAWKRSALKFTVTWHYDHLLPDGQVQRLTVQAAHSLEPPEAYYKALSQAGLQTQEVYGDFDRSPFTPDSLYLILVATRS